MIERKSEGVSTWAWIVFLVLALAVVFFSASAWAGTVTVTYDAPGDPDLKECRFFLQNSAGGAIDNKVVLAADLGVGKQVSFTYSTISLQNSQGKVVARCVDQFDQVSIDSTPLAAIFPDVLPSPPVLRSLQVVP